MGIFSNLKNILKDEFECKECGKVKSNKNNYDGYCEECKDITLFCSECGKETYIKNINFIPIGAICDKCNEETYECKECGREINYHEWKVCGGFCNDCDEELNVLLQERYDSEPRIEIIIEDNESFECTECGREIWIYDMVEDNICKFCYRAMYGTDDPVAASKVK